MRDARVETPVLIVGGGISGLSTALFLARQGVRPVLVERHPTESIMPKARAFNPRSMEIFRGFGLEADIRERLSYLSDFPLMIGADTLVGAERFSLNLSAHVEPPPDLSPTDWAAIDQDELERVLRAAAVEAGADIRFDTEMISLEHDADGVRVDVQSGGHEYRIEASYLVAADGHRAGIRKRLGIGTEQLLEPVEGCYVIFEADLSAALRGRRFILAYLSQPVPGTTLVPVGPDRWTTGFAYGPGTGQHPDDFTEQHCVDMLRQAIGLPDVEITLLPPIPGRPAKVAHSAAGGGGSVAHRFRQGRIFLVGDAAHVVPPTGSYGASTGIADAHNLAWKLTSVLNGHAGPGLLDTYEEERRPVARTTLYHAMSLLQARMSGGDEDNEVTDDITMMFGYRYESSAVRLEAETDIPVQDPRTHTGEPGLRAPHVWLEQRGKRFSTTELCTEFWSLLIGPDGGQWEEAGKSVAAELGVDLRTCRIGAELRDPDDRLLDCYGITAAGCSLVRPDGFVAWRHQAGSAHAEPTLRCVIANLLSLTACR